MMSFYGKIYRGIFWPAYEKARGRQTHLLLKEAEKRQWESPEKIRDFQWQELKKLLAHAYENSPWYRARFDAAGLAPHQIKSHDDFERLPLVSKEDIRCSHNEMIATNYRTKIFSHNTGGSTGSPLRFYITRQSYEWRNAMTLRGYGWAGCREGDKQFFIFGVPIGTPPLKARIKSRVHDIFIRRRLFNAFGLSEPAMAECLRQLNAFRPKTIVAYTNPLYLLARHILEHKFTAFSPQAIITAAEGVNSVQRATIEKAFGAPVFASYGSREFKLISMECEQHEGLHLSADNLLIEVVVGDKVAAEGEVGEIVITDLHNYGMPFIRYKIGDLGIATRRICSCGRGLPLLQGVEGRQLDVIRTPDGRVLPGEFFPHLMKEFEAVRQFQVIQKQLDILHIKLVLKDGDHTTVLQQIDREIRSTIGDAIKLNIERVSEIPLTSMGKFRVTVSEL